MSDNLKVGLTIGANDEATPVVKGLRNELAHLATARSNLGVRAEHTIQREIQKTQASYNRMARSGKLSEAELARAYNEMKKRVAALRVEMEREAEQTRNNYQRMATARETLGIQSETKIQREIQRTQAAYNRLANSGTLSAQEQARAFTATQNRVAALRKELKGAQADETSLGKKLLVAGAAVGAAAHYLAPKIDNSSEYSMELMKLSNRVFHNRDEAGRQKGKQEINATVTKATELGGGDVGDTLKGYEGLVSSQAFTPKQVDQLLPRINMTAASVGANPYKVAELASSLHFFKIPTDKIPNALSAVVRMGQMGPVDADVIAEHAKGMFEQLGGIGGGGYQGLRAVLPLAESSALGAATPAQALTNATDLVNDILSPNLDNAAKRIKINGKKINWHQSIIKMMGQGIDPLEAARTIVNKAIDNDKQYQSLNGKLKQTTDPTQRDRLERQMQAVRGVYMGKFFRNQQARMSFIAYEQHYDKVKSLQGALDQEYYGKPGELATDKDMAGVYKEPEFQKKRAGNLSILDQNSILKPVANIEGDVADEFTKLYEALPNVTAGLVGLGLALKGAGLLGLAGVTVDGMFNSGNWTKGAYQSLKGSWNRFRGKAGTVAGEVVDGAESAADDVVETAKGGFRSLRRGVGRFAGPAIALVTGAYDTYETHNDTSLTPEQKDKRYVNIATRTTAAEGGAEFGAGVGSVVFPGPGTAIGGALGGILGYLGGGWLGQKFSDNLFVNKQKTPNAVMPSDALGLNPQRLDVHLYVDGQELHAALDDRTQREAQRN